MRAVSLSISLIFAMQGFADAATFQCEFSPKTGSQNDFTCAVDTMADLRAAAGKCRQDFSSSLYSECDGRSPGGTNQLICYFASPASPPNLNATSVIDQAGVYAVVIEWLVAQPVESIVLDFKDGKNSRSVTCSPD